MPVHVPIDGSTVWVRRWILGPAFQATWSLAAQTFTATNGLIVPWNEVWRWKLV